MVFPAIPATGNSTLLTSQAVGTGTARTFPSLTSLAKGSGDLMVAVIVAYQASATNATFSGWGGGFTEFADTGNSATPTTAIGAAYKWSDGTETGTFTVTQAATITGDAVMFLMAIPGAHPSVAPAAGALATGTTGAANPASFTSGFGARDTLWIAVCGSSETSTTSNYTGCASAPANYTGYAEAGMTQDAVGACDGSVSFRQLNAASEDVGAAGVDVSNARNAALVLAVRPAVDTLQAAGAAEGGGSAYDATAYTQDGVVSSTESLDTVSVQVLYVPPPVTPAGNASAAGEALAATPVTAAFTAVTPASADAAGAAYSASAVTGQIVTVQAGGAGPVTVLAWSDTQFDGSGGTQTRATAVAALLAGTPHDLQLYGGDHTNDATDPEWAAFSDTFAAFKATTYPVPGNHDDDPARDNGAHYWAYWGTQAGTSPDAWYSFDTPNGWHVVMCDQSANGASIASGSDQYAWLSADLDDHAGMPTLAVWHWGRYSASSAHGGNSGSADAFALLIAHGAEMLLSGHQHNYERYGRMDNAGAADAVNGVAQWTLPPSGQLTTNTESGSPAPLVSDTGAAFGILKLVLYADHYTWEVLVASGSPALTDTGSQDTRYAAAGGPPQGTGEALGATFAVSGPFTATPGSADGTGLAYNAAPGTGGGGGGAISAPWVGTVPLGNVSGTAATSGQVNISGAADGDVVFICGYVSDAQTSAISPPGGWAELGTQTSEGTTGGSSSRAFVFWKVKQAGDSTVTVSWPVSAKYQLAPVSWPGADTTTPAEGLSWAVHSSGTSYVTGASTPGGTDRWAVGVFGSNGSTSAVAWTPDAALTERADVTTTSARMTGLEVADSNGTVTQASHTYTATGQTASHGISGLFYLIPGAGAPAATTVTPGSADGTGTGYDAAVTTASTAGPGQADGTGAGHDAAVTASGTAAPPQAAAAAQAYDTAVTGTGTAFPAAADGTGAAYNAAVTTGLIAYPPSADGTGAGYDAAVAAASTVAAIAAAGTGAAYDITPVTAGTTYVQPAQADAAALAYDGAASGSGTGIPAGADGTGQGLDAGATSASTAAPATASAAGLAYDATPAVSAAGQVLADGAAATGAAYDAGWTASGNAPAIAADGTGQGLDAAPAAVAYTNVTAASADGTGAAYQPAWTASGAATPGSADAAGLAYDSPPGGSASIPAGSAGAMGAAWPPTPVYARLTLPGSADGAGTALDAVICITIAIQAAEAAGQALAAYIPPQVVFGRSVPGTATADHASADGGTLAERATAGGILVGTATPGSG